MKDRYRCPVCGWMPNEHEPDNAWEHCPNCLCSKHDEDEEGFDCGGTLEPISIWVKPTGEWEIIQRCRVCGGLSVTALSKDDSPIKALEIASRALSSPPFPIEKLEQLAEITGGSSELDAVAR